MAGAVVLVLRRRLPLVAVAAFVLMTVASLLATIEEILAYEAGLVEP